MAKSKQIIRPLADSEIKIGLEKRKDFTEQGLTIKWTWIKKLIEFLKQGKQNRIKRNRGKNVSTKISRFQ